MLVCQTFPGKFSWRTKMFDFLLETFVKNFERLYRNAWMNWSDGCVKYKFGRRVILEEVGTKRFFAQRVWIVKCVWRVTIVFKTTHYDRSNHEMMLKKKTLELSIMTDDKANEFVDPRRWWRHKHWWHDGLRRTVSKNVVVQIGFQRMKIKWNDRSPRSLWDRLNDWLLKTIQNKYIKEKLD